MLGSNVNHNATTACIPYFVHATQYRECKREVYVCALDEYGTVARKGSNLDPVGAVKTHVREVQRPYPSRDAGRQVCVATLLLDS